MEKLLMYAKDLKEGYIIYVNNDARLVKYVDVGPKSVYVKTLGGKTLSFAIHDRLEVVT